MSLSMIIIFFFVDEKRFFEHGNALFGLAQHTEFIADSLIQGRHKTNTLRIRWHHFQKHLVPHVSQYNKAIGKGATEAIKIHFNRTDTVSHFAEHLSQIDL